MTFFAISTNLDLGPHSSVRDEIREVPDDVMTTKRTNHLGVCDDWGRVCERCPLPDGCIKTDINSRSRKSPCPIDVAHYRGWRSPDEVLAHSVKLDLLEVCGCGRELSAEGGYCYYCDGFG